MHYQRNARQLASQPICHAKSGITEEHSVPHGQIPNTPRAQSQLRHKSSCYTAVSAAQHTSAISTREKTSTTNTPPLTMPACDHPYTDLAQPTSIRFKTAPNRPQTHTCRYACTAYTMHQSHATSLRMNGQFGSRFGVN